MSSNTNNLRKILNILFDDGRIAYANDKSPDVCEQYIDRAEAMVLALLPEKKTLETDLPLDADEDEDRFCVECGHYEFEGKLDCKCVGFNFAIDQTRRNLIGEQQHE